MKASYILRIDDVCPTMKWGPFLRIMDACRQLGIRPLLGVVPDNRDSALMHENARTDFWEYIANLDATIAQHGYQHVYTERKTEFAGLPYEVQLKKIRSGQAILREKLGYAPTWFMAPAHSFDAVTCQVLQELSFSYITDGVALYPFVKDGLVWVPQQLWRPKAMPFGLWTFCLHTNTMSDADVTTIIGFMSLHAKEFQDVSLAPRSSLLTLPMRFAWNIVRRSKGI